MNKKITSSLKTSQLIFILALGAVFSGCAGSSTSEKDTPQKDAASTNSENPPAEYPSTAPF